MNRQIPSLSAGLCLSEVVGKTFKHYQNASIRWHFGMDDWANQTNNVLFTVHKQHPGMKALKHSLIEIWVPERFEEKKFPYKYKNFRQEAIIKNHDEEVALILLNAFAILDQEWEGGPTDDHKAVKLAISLLSCYRDEYSKIGVDG